MWGDWFSSVGLGILSCVLVLIAIDHRPSRSVVRIERAGVASLFVAAAFVLVVGAHWSLLAPTVAVVSGLLGHLLFRSEIRRRAELGRLQELPVVVEILARRVSMGSTVRGAVASLSDHQRSVVGMSEVEARIGSGQGVASALSDSTSLAAAALLVTEISGETSPVALERLADRLGSSALDGRAAQSQSGQQLASAAVMSLLPPMVSVLYGLSDERAAQFYLGTTMGSAVVAVSLLLSGAGWFWMRYITRPRPVT